MRVVFVSGYLDERRRSPQELVHQWPTLTDVPAAVAKDPGIQVSVLNSCHVDAEVQRLGVTVRFVRDSPGWPRGRRVRRLLGLSRRLLEAVRAREPDVLHLHGLWAPRQVAALRRFLPHAGLMVQDHADGLPPRWYRPVYRRAFRHADGVLFTARDQARPFFEHGYFPDGLPVFEALESSTWFTPGARDDARRALGVDGDPCVAWVGRFNANKDPLTVLRAFERALARIPNARLWMCGEGGPLEASARALVRSTSDLAGRVTFLGRRSHADVQHLFRAADLLVAASHREGSGYAVLEAIASGCTPLVTDIPSFRAITGNGRVGAIVPCDDATAFADRIVEWAGDDREALRKRARRHFDEALSFDVLGRTLRDVYRTVTDRA